MRKTLLSTVVASVFLTACVSSTDNADSSSVWPHLDIAVKPDQATEDRVSALLASMTVEQKVAQVIQPEIGSITPEDMRQYGFGSYLNGGGSFPGSNKHATPQEWINLAEAMYQASVDDSKDGSTIPTMWGTDAVHGHNNVIGATLFPHNIGLGAANNPELMEQIANITAKEVMATGIDWVFAPTVAVVRDDRWGRTYESYSEDPEIVKAYAASVVKGLQGHADAGDFLGDERVISTVKHFVGDGGTVKGDDQGDNIASEQTLFDIHAQGYVGGLTAGAQSVMASFNSWHGKKLHGHKYLLTDVLKDRMGFDGFVVGDWNGHGQIKGCTNDNCAQAINAGLDIYMVPSDWKALYHNTVAQVKDGTISSARLDDAVRRILRVKMRAGLFDKASPAQRPLSGKQSLIGSEEHRKVARQAVKESLVLLKNKQSLLPLSASANILVAGDAADNIGKQSGGWTITWQGTNNTNDDFPGGTSVFDGISQYAKQAGGNATLSVDGSYSSKPDVAIVVFGEEPYAEGVGDRETLAYQPGNQKDLALLKKLKEDGIPVVSVFISGRPMWVNAELNASDAFVAAWLPGSEGAAVAEVLFGDTDFKGKLPFSWPASPLQIANVGDDDYAPLLPYGFGLTFSDKNVLPDNLNEQDESLKQQSAESVAILQSGVRAPWSLQLTSNNEHKTVAASAESFGSITYRTSDKVVQEDAITVTFDGKTPAGITFTRTGSGELVAPDEIAETASLVFSVNVSQPFSDDVFVTLCSEQQDSDKACSSGVNIAPALSGFEANSWQSMALPLKCFASPDVNTLTTAFALRTSGSGSLSLADMFIQQTPEESRVLACE
ncbi:MAG: glycoside hydrolase family 3 N-terminal domain-containing protein [Pseudomonadota bacterium]|nr:glycoside hydrolase family 3 N-terminal domain-containing protein [Pseudomonadota bacterium]